MNKMRKILVMAMCGAMLASCHRTAEKTMETANTIPVLEDDSPEAIIEKAAHVVPTDNQMAAMENEFIAFIHFGPNTFTLREWGSGMEDPKVFDLKELDTDQWCETMKAAGMKMVVLTVKHHDGFVLWQSRYTDHGIMSTDFEGGKGDILKNLSESCQKYGLKLGIYLSPADLYQIESPEGLYGNLSEYTMRTIPREVQGRPFASDKKFEFEVDDYNEYFLNQLYELLTEYGPVHELWFDGAHPKRKGGQRYNYRAWKELINELAPEAVIFGKEDIRWCGNEAGGTRQTEFNVIPYQFDPDTANYFPDMMDIELAGRDQLAQAKYLHYQPAETNTSIREGWFFRDDDKQRVRSADDVFDIYERSVGGNSIFMLNIPPNREGKFSDRDVAALKEVGKRIEETYGTDLLAGASGPKALLDSDPNTYEVVEDAVEIKLPKAATINRLLLQEAVKEAGERVEEFSVDVNTPEGWKEVAQGTNIGYKRIVRFPDVTTDKVRVRILQARMTPALSKISAHHYQSRPPELEASQSPEGLITITPRTQAFGWHNHGNNAAENLNAGYTIYYTTDGTEPNESSAVYQEPFALESAVLKAVAVVNGETGAVMEKQVGYPTGGYATTVAYKGDLPLITIDLGASKPVAGVAYVPTKRARTALMAQGSVHLSQDGRTWTNAGSFNFGNLINDPSTRYYYLLSAANARFVKIEATEMTPGNKSDSAPVVEIF